MVFGVKHEGLGEVLGAAEVDDAVDATAEGGEGAEGAFEFFDTATGAEEGAEVAAGGASPDDDAVGVEVILLGVAANPADGGLAVVDLGGPRGLLAEAVADTNGGVVAGARHLDASGAVANAVAIDPAATVDEGDDGEGFVVGGLIGEVKVQGLFWVFVVGVGEVEFEGDGALFG